jgi:hypothetical protein
MRSFGIVALCGMLGGCAASSQEVVQRLGTQYIGQSTDMMVRDFGPPTSTYRLQSGENSMVWLLTAVTDISANNGYAQASTRACKVSVIADPKGIVERLDTEDSNAGTGIVPRLTGMYGSICAQRLGMKPQT